VPALALEQGAGDVYLVFPFGNTVHQSDPAGNTELPSIAVRPLHEGEEVSLQGMAVDALGRVAV
jgi:hypothetical protein